MNALSVSTRRLVVGLACGAVLGLGATTASRASLPPTAGTYAMLPLVAGETGMPYQVLASKAERVEYADAISARIRARGGAPVPGAAIGRALANAGIDQESPYRACDDAACARKIGRAVGADAVVYGSVTRALAMIWGSELSIVDVATGRVRGPYDLGYKGDFLTLRTGVDELATAVSNRLIADNAARVRARAMARR